MRKENYWLLLLLWCYVSHYYLVIINYKFFKIIQSILNLLWKSKLKINLNSNSLLPLRTLTKLQSSKNQSHRSNLTITALHNTTTEKITIRVLNRINHPLL